MIRLFSASLVLAWSLLAEVVFGADDLELTDGRTVATVTEVVDGDTVVLDSGREVRLVGLQAPKLPLGRKNFPTWPLAGAAKRALESLTLGRQVKLSFGGRRIDRHGRLLAHLSVADGADGWRWVQGAMLERGMARVYSFVDNRWRVEEMLDLERQARSARRGIWAESFYRVRRPGDAARHIGSFQLIEGRVLAAAEVKGRVYLNFGPDWRTDFTATLQPAARRRFEAAGINAEDYEDRIIRVRGWLKSFNGPMIEITHPEQIEVIAP